MNSVSMGARPRAVLLFPVLVALGGCSVLQDAYMVDSLTKDTGYTDVNSHRPGQQLVPPAFNLLADTTPDGVSYNSIVKESDDAAKQKADRNRLSAYLVNRSNLICEWHEASIMADASSIDFTLSQTSTVLSGVGALVTGVNASRALSGAAAIIDGTQGNFNSNFYQDKLASAIVKSIDGARKNELVNVVAGRSKDYSDYSVDDMVLDVVKYNQQCSFFSGVVALTDAAGRVTPSGAELKAKLDDFLNAQKQLAASGNADPAVASALQQGATAAATAMQLNGVTPQ